MKTNPYIAGNPVGGESAFIGRADVLRDVLRVLKSESENGMVLYGQRRIGKTSVLQELKTVLPQHGNFAPVYFDLQDKAALSLDQVLTELSHRILYTLDIPAVDIPKEDFSAAFQNIFLPHVLSHLPEQTALVLLLDEFDVLDNPGNKQAGAVFFPYLRDLMAEDVKRLQFVFVIGRRPEDLSSVYLSLFKGVKSSHVSLMSEKDTADLVRLSEKNDSLKWTDDVAAQVYQVSGGHPFLTQQLCQVIWNNLYDDDPEEPPTVQSDDVKNSVQEAIRTATNSLEWLWNGLQPAQRIVASALAEAGPKLITQQELEKHLHDSGVRILIGELQDAPRVLAEWDVIQPEDGGYRMRVEMLRQWIAERKPLSRVRDEMDRILPAAENLFQAAYSIYQGGQLDDAEPLLRQSVRLNPNHLKANQLLAEIYLAQGNHDKALKILEVLYEYNPSEVKHRLVQVLLNKGKEVKGDEKISIYERILKIDPNHSESIVEYKKIYENQGDIACKNNEFDKALEAYKKAGLKEKIEQVNKKRQLETLYQQALNALEKNEKEEAQQLMRRILWIEPSFKDSNRYRFYIKISDDNKNQAGSFIFLLIFSLTSIFLLTEKISYYLFKVIESYRTILPLSISELIVNHSKLLFIFLFILISASILCSLYKLQSNIYIIFFMIFLLVSAFLLAEKIVEKFSYYLFKFLESYKNILPLNMSELIINNSPFMFIVLSVLVTACIIYFLFKIFTNLGIIKQGIHPDRSDMQKY